MVAGGCGDVVCMMWRRECIVWQLPSSWQACRNVSTAVLLLVARPEAHGCRWFRLHLVRACLWLGKLLNPSCCCACALCNAVFPCRCMHVTSGIVR
jgi:hypothetical protein